MTVVSPMNYAIPCPSCGANAPPHLKYCWSCGAPIYPIHERCGVCGKPVGHGRHRIEGRLAYSCGCGFAATKKEELDQHLRKMK